MFSGKIKPGRLLSMKILVPVLGIIIALLVGAVIFFIEGLNPIDAYIQLINGAFGNETAFGDTLYKTGIFLIAGLGVSIAFTGRIFNIGAEGQMSMAALAVTTLALTIGDVPSVVMIPLCLLVAFVVGGLWGAIAGILRAKLRINEIITTLMLNHVAVLFMGYMVAGPIRNPEGTFPGSKLITQTAWLPTLLPKTTLNASFLLALALPFIVYLILSRSVLGYRIRCIGGNPESASYAGINVSKYIVIIMFLSGALAGIAGTATVLGVSHYLDEDFAGGYGYTSVLISLLGYNNPAGIVASSFLFAVLDNGFKSVHRVMGVPVGLALLMQGLVILFVVGGRLIVGRRK